MDVDQLLQRELGKGLMSGGSPTSMQTQAINTLQEYLNTHTQDSWGSISALLLQWVEHDASLSNNYNQPTIALKHTIDWILANENSLHEFVRQVDMHYGERNQEKPIFQKPGDAPNPEDEHTHQSVATFLQALRAKL